MFDTRKIAADFTKASAVYADNAGLQKRIGETLIAHTLPYMKLNSSLLDAGAGSGDVTLLWPCADKVALDVAIGMCRQSAAHPTQAVCATAESLPFSSTLFDIVSSNLMLQWLERPELFFAEAWRVLKPGGILAVSTFTEGSLSQLKQAFGTVSNHMHISPFITHAALEKLIGEAGFISLESHSQSMNEAHDTVENLLKSLRIIGAGNKLTQRAKGLMTPRIFKRMLYAYPRSTVGIEAEWVVGYAIARKPL